MPFIGYLVFFYLAWTFVWVYGLYPWANRAIGRATLRYAAISIGSRLLIWVLPVFGYLRYIDKTNVWVYLRLKQYWRRGIAVGAHIPGWIMLGSLTLRNSTYIFVFGAIMAIVFKFSRSLWAPRLPQPE